MGQPLSVPVVLVVEDEPFIRLNTAETLRDAGFVVREAASAAEAIGILERHTDVSLVFTDIQMPGSMDGLRLAAAVRDRWPPVKIVATSGNVQVSARDLPEGGRFLPKPYSSRQLTDLFREMAPFH